MGLITKRPGAKEDLLLWDGVDATETGETSTGRTMTLHTIDWPGVDVAAVYGGNATTHAAISAAMTAIGTDDLVSLWLQPGTWTLTSNLTTTSNLAVEPPPGCIIDVGAHALVIQGPFQAGMYQCFDVSGGGSVDIQQGEVVPEHFGAAGDGTTDDTDALLAWAACGAETKRLPCRTYLFDDTVTITKKENIYSQCAILEFNGSGKNAFEIKPDTGNINMLNLDGHLEVRRSTIDYTDAYAGIYLEALYASTLHVSVYGFEKGIYAYGNGTYGVTSNHIHMGQISNCKYGNYLDCADSDGWVNANYWYGGRFYGSTAGMSKHIYVSESPYANNGNKWLWPVLEGKIADQLLFELKGTRNEIYVGYAEHDGGTMPWALLAGTGCSVVSKAPYMPSASLYSTTAGGFATGVAAVTAGAITAISSITTGGAAWTTGDYCYILSKSGGVSATGTVTATSGAVTAVTITAGGSGFTDAETVHICEMQRLHITGTYPHFHGLQHSIDVAQGNFNTVLCATSANAQSVLDLWNASGNSGTALRLLNADGMSPGVAISARGESWLVKGSADETIYKSVLWTSTASPTEGPWRRGDIAWKTLPSSGSEPGWVCVFHLNTTLDGGEPSGETAMAVASGTGTQDGDIIGVMQDDATIKWSTVASGGGTTTLTMAAALTDDAADGNAVYVIRWKAMANLA